MCNNILEFNSSLTIFYLRYLVIFLIFNVNNLNGEGLPKKILDCKINNSNEYHSFIFESDEKVKFKIRNSKNIISEGFHNYEITKDLIIISNHDVFPMRVETHINLKNLQMKTGVFTNRYPLVRRGECSFK